MAVSDCAPGASAAASSSLRLGGMFVQSDKFVRAHGGRIGDIAISGQESNYTTWRLCKMNLAVRGIDEQRGQLPQGRAAGS
jgi:type I restriction-modification system DNA methylase subunit